MRTFHSNSRTWSNFQPAELVKLCGVPAGRWPVYVLKELVDNAMAALEDHQIPNPRVHITLVDDYIEVLDNGPGLSDAILDQVLDFDKFGGSNRHHKLPTRGAQGNALMTIVGIATAWVGNRDVKMEFARAKSPRVGLKIELDTVREHVGVERVEVGPPGMSGVRIYIPPLPWKPRGSSMDDLVLMAQMMARVNPHINVFLSTAGAKQMFISEPEAAPSIDYALCGAVSWFTKEEFAARLAADVRSRPQTPIRKWLGEFAHYRPNVQRVNEKYGVDSIGERADGATEVEFFQFSEELRIEATISTDAAKAASPKQLHPVGMARLRGLLVDEFGADAEIDAEYQLRRETVKVGPPVPYLVEVCLVQMPIGCTAAPEPLLMMNRTVLYGSPHFRDLRYREKVHGEWRQTSGDISALCHAYGIANGKTACAVIVHVTSPSPGYTGYGKQQFETAWLSEALSEAFERVTLKVRKQRAGEMRRVRKGDESDETIREVLWSLIPGVLERDTENGRLNIMLRQLYYGVRKVWHLHHHKPLQYGTYCAYLAEYEEKIAKQQVCLKDPRGTLIEPHSGRELRLGTDAVNKYEPKKWEGHTIIFIEKEQFAMTLKQYGVTKRYDAIVIGSKGFAVEACREVLQKYKKLLGDMVKIIVVHDADPSGYALGYDLATNLPRFGDTVDVQVLDIGLTIAEAEEMGLPEEFYEPFDLKKSTWSMVKNMRKMVQRGPDGNLRPLLDNPAWDRFMPHEFRRERYDWDSDSKNVPQGRRMEINALSPRQLITWLEKHLDANGCKKVRPPDAVVEDVVKNARQNMVQNQMGAFLMEQLGDDMVHEILGKIGVPTIDLDSLLVAKPEQSWHYISERAAQSGVDLVPLMKDAFNRRMGKL